MIVRIFLVTMSFLFSIQNAHQIVINHLEFVEENEPIAKLIERLYLSSNRLPNEINSFYTYRDIEVDLLYWKDLNLTPTMEQSQLILKIDKILSTISQEEINFEHSTFYPTIEIHSGIDYLYHAKYNAVDEDSLYFNVFRDRDYITKFYERSNLFTLRIKSSYRKYIYFS